MIQEPEVDMLRIQKDEDLERYRLVNYKYNCVRMKTMNKINKNVVLMKTADEKKIYFPYQYTIFYKI